MEDTTYDDYEIDYGLLTPYILNDDITDINCNSRQVWVNHVLNGRYMINIDFGENEINQLAYRISNIENVQFNVMNPVLQADIGGLRFHFTHPSFSTSGISLSIRKSPIVKRLNQTMMLDSDIQYLSEYGIALLQACMISKCNIVTCGLTSSGKTELTKWLMGFTEDYERIITIEDTLELHLSNIYPNKDIVELKVNGKIGYEEAIKSSMRMLPTWLLLSEARGKEVKYLLKSISTGAKIATTIHVDNAKQIPLRLLNMFEDNELDNDKIETMIYDFLNIGIHIKADFKKGRTIRYVDQIVYFDIDENNQKRCYPLYEVKINYKEGKAEYCKYPLPTSLKERFISNGYLV